MRDERTRSRGCRRSPRTEQRLRARLKETGRRLKQLFAPATINKLRQQTGYNPRLRHATAYRLLIVVVEAFLFGQTLCFARLRAFFVRRFGAIRARAFQLRFKSAKAAAFFRSAFERLVQTVVVSASLRLTGPLAKFQDVRVYDATGQRVPPRGCAELPACVAGRAGAKCLVGYSLTTGLVEEALLAAETASELPMWRLLAGELRSGVLYLMDLAFFERALFARAKTAGAHLLMRLKTGTRVVVTGHLAEKRYVALPSWSLSKYLQTASRRRGTLYDVDVRWGRGRDAIDLRVVGVAHGGEAGIRWYLTTVTRDQLSAAEIVETYRLRWLIEFLFREMKQNADIGRSATADPNALQALTYGAMIGHVVVRSLRVTAALSQDIPLEQLRPLAVLHAVRPFAGDLADALLDSDPRTWHHLLAAIATVVVAIGREVKPSKSRPRVAQALGASGA